MILAFAKPGLILQFPAAGLRCVSGTCCSAGCKYPKNYSCLITTTMVIYPGPGIAIFEWMCIHATAMWLRVWSYSHHTCTAPPPYSWAATASPRDAIKSPGRKAGLSGWTLRRDRLAGQFLSLLVSKGSLARCRRPQVVRAKQKCNLSPHSWLTRSNPNT